MAVNDILVSRMGAVGMVLLGLIKTLITVWELVTNWAYSLLTNPSQKLQDYSRVLSAPQEEIKENDTEVVMHKFVHKYCILQTFVRSPTYRKRDTRHS